MRHLSYDSSGPRFVLHLDKKRQHAGDSAVDVVTAETEETSVFLPFYTRTAPGWQRRAGGGALPAFSCAHSPSQESVHGNKVTWGEATIQGRLYPGHTPLIVVVAHVYNIGDITQTVSNRNQILYRTRKLGRIMVLLYEKRGAFSLKIKQIDIWKPYHDINNTRHPHFWDMSFT